MLSEPLAAFFEEGDGKPEWARLLEILSAANSSQDAEELTARCLDALGDLIPFQFAVFLLFQTDTPHIVLSSPRHVPDEIRAELETLHLPDDFFHALSKSNGADRLEQAKQAIQVLTAAHGYGIPICVPLIADGHGMGVLVLAANAHPEAVSEWLDLQMQYKRLLDVVGMQVGVAVQRAQLTRRLHDSEQWYRNFIEQGLDGFWEFDGEGAMRFVNSAGLDILGVTREEALGRRIEEVTRPDMIALTELRRQLRTKGFVTDFHLNLSTADGQAKTVSLTIRAVYDEFGFTTGYQGVVRDITATARALKELEYLNREAKLWHEFATRLNAPFTANEAIERALDLITSLTTTEWAAVFLINDERTACELVGKRSIYPSALEAYTRLPLNRAIYAPSFNPEHAANFMEYLVLTRRALRADEIKLPSLHLGGLIGAGYSPSYIFPIRYGEHVDGAVFVGSQVPQSYNAHDLQLFDDISAQLGLMLYNRHLIADLQRQVQQGQALARSARSIQYAPSAEEGLPAVVDEIQKAFRASYVELQLLKENHFEIITASDRRERQRIFSIPRYAQRILETDAPLAVEDADAPETDPEQREILRRLQLRSTLAVRLFVYDHALGILFVNHDVPHFWREDEQLLIRQFARQIAYALENKRLLDEIKNHVRVLRALAFAGRLIGSEKTPEDALQPVASQIARVFPADYVSFHLREGDQLRLVAESKETDAPRTLPILPHQRHILDELHTTRVDNIEHDAEHASQREYLMRYQLVADLGVPIFVENKALGILYISHYKVHHWTDAEVRLAQFFAQQLAVSLTNAQLLKDTKRQVLELKSLERSAQLLAMSRSLESALPQAARELREMLAADYVGFHLLEGNELYAITDSAHPIANTRYPLQPYHSVFIHSFQRMIVNDRERDCKDPGYSKTLKDNGIQADIGMPMITRGKCIGVVFVSQYTPRAWQETEVRIVEAYARQIATLVDNVQLLNEREERLLELEKLSDLYEITAPILDEDALTDIALAELKNLLNAHDVALLLLEGDDRLKPMRMAVGPVIPPQPPPLTPLLQSRLATSDPLIIDREHPVKLSPHTKTRLSEYNARALLLLSLTTASKPIGLLLFLFHDDHLITDSEIRLARAAANQIAMAFVNTRLMRQQKQRIDKLNQLAAFGLACSAIRDSQALMEIAAPEICSMLEAPASSIRLVEDGYLTIGASHGFANPSARNHKIPLGSYLEEFLKRQAPYVIANLETEPDLPSHWRERHLKEGFRSALMAAMIAENRVIGILSVYYKHLHRSSDAHIQFTQTIANTLALAISYTKQMETADQTSGELQATWDSVVNGVLATDAEGVIRSWNRAAERITGVSAQEMLGKRWHVDGPRIGTARQPDNLILEAMADNAPRYGTAPREFTRPDGRIIPLNEVATPLRDRAGRVRGAVCAFWERLPEADAESARGRRGVDLQELVQQSIQRQRAQKRGRRFVNHVESIAVRADAPRLNTALDLLLEAAVQSSARSSRITLQTRPATPNHVALTIHYHANSSPADEENEFWRVLTKLAEMDGTLELERNARRGVTFVVTLLQAV